MMILNNFMTALFKIINNTENKDTNFVIAYFLLTHIKEIENMKLQGYGRCLLCINLYTYAIF